VWCVDLERLVSEYCESIKKIERVQEDENWEQVLQEVLIEHKLDKEQLEYGFCESINNALQNNADSTDLSVQLTVEREDLELLVISYWRVLEIYEEAYRRYWF
jgi:hypothetical protein